MRWFALLSISLIVLSGCASGVPDPKPDPTFLTQVEPVWIEGAFKPAELASVRQALAEWNFALNGYLQFRIETEKYRRSDLAEVGEQINTTGRGTIITRATAAEAMEENLPVPGVLGWTDSDRIGVHILCDAIGSEDMRLVVLHELGHSLGLTQHAGIPDTLMSAPHQRMCGCVDRFTLMQLAGRRDWDWHRLRPCDHPR